MPAGFQAFTDDGVAQIDGKYSNLQLVAKGTATSALTTVPFYSQPNGTFYYDVPVAYVSFSGTSPVFAISGETPAAVVATSVSGSTWTVTIWTPLGAGNVDWFVFDRAATVGSSYGGQVFDDSGALIFDARAKYLKVIGNVLDLVPVYSSGQANGFTSPFTTTYPFSGKRVAIAAMLTPINLGDVRWPDGTNRIPSNPNCRALGLGCWRGVIGAAIFDFVHAIVTRGYYASVGGQQFAFSAAVDDNSVPFGVRQYGALLIDVTNY